MKNMLARLGSLIIWLALILCALMDFTGTFFLCLITVGIGSGGWYLAEAIALLEGQSVQALASRVTLP
jgi:hypothetical protein